MLIQNLAAWGSLLVSVILMVLASIITLRIVLIAISLRWRLPFVPSDAQTTRYMVRQIPEQARVIVDLGSGNGTLVSAIAKKFPHATVRGYETNRALAWISTVRCVFRRNKPVIERSDLFYADLRDADVIVGFWINTIMHDLLEKFIRECKPGCVIVCNAVPLPPSTYFSEVTHSVPRTLFGRGRVYVYTKRS